MSTSLVPFWPLLSVFLFILWLSTTWAWRRNVAQYAYQAQANPFDLPSAHHYRDIQARLRQACLDNDPGNTTQALLKWAKHYWRQQPPLSLGALAQHWPQHYNALQELDQAQYGRTRPLWDGHTFWQRLATEFEYTTN